MDLDDNLMTLELTALRDVSRCRREPGGRVCGVNAADVALCVSEARGRRRSGWPTCLRCHRAAEGLLRRRAHPGQNLRHDRPQRQRHLDAAQHRPAPQHGDEGGVQDDRVLRLRRGACRHRDRRRHRRLVRIPPSRPLHRTP